MRKLMVGAVFAFSLLLAGGSQAEQTGAVRRPIDNALGTFLDHTYSLYNGATWWCLESFGGGCDCAGQSDCTWAGYNGSGWKNADRATATTCASWISGNWTYLVQGVCHQATANENWYIQGTDLSGASPGVRGLSVSNANFGTWGTDYSGCP